MKFNESENLVMFTVSHLVVLLMVFFVATSCSDSDQSPFILGDQAILGEWRGQFYVSGEGQEQSFPVHLSLQSNASFTIKNLSANQLAQGNFDQAPSSQSLVFQYRSSQISGLALAGQNQNFQYSVIDQKLNLIDSQKRFDLDRFQDTSKIQKLLDGNWSCDNADDHDLIKINIEANRFWYTLIPSPGVATLFRGDVTYPAEVGSGENIANLDPREISPPRPAQNAKITYFVQNGRAASPIKMTVTDNEIATPIQYICRLIVDQG